MNNNTRQINQQLLIIIVASLGYFVDIYDLILFNVVKKQSLLELGLHSAENEIFLFNCQMGGMLIGGILWGIMGDRLGRIKVLFGSILMYSVANIVNAWVWDLPSYAAVRFIAGVGLAGELGAGITLISEIMKKEKRGYGTMIVVTFGALGAVVAALVAAKFNWKTSYYVGGGMGLALLILRAGALESGMFKNVKQSHVTRGDFLSLFSNTRRLKKYLHCIAIGLPVWFVVGVLISLAETYFHHKTFNIGIENFTGKAVMYCYIGLSVGDFLAGLLSQLFRSRLKVVIGYLFFSVVVILLFLFSMQDRSATFFYFMCTMLGIGTGYWALFVTIAAEQFGTNIRATVTSTVPNFVRGAVIPITFSFKELAKLPSVGIVGSALIVGGACLGLAIISTLSLKETFGKDLDYLEEEEKDKLAAPTLT